LKDVDFGLSLGALHFGTEGVFKRQLGCSYISWNIENYFRIAITCRIKGWSGEIRVGDGANYESGQPIKPYSRLHHIHM
jgi:hypothetical protein